jgi:L-asparagine permease
MSMAGSAPKFAGLMNRNQVPYGGIMLTSAVCVLGVGLNYVVPGKAFEIVLNIAALGIISTWCTIMLCHMVFVRRTKEGLAERPRFRLPGTPVTDIATITFLLGVIVLMWFDDGVGRQTVMLIPVIGAALIVGWFAVRGRVNRIAAERSRPGGR